MEYSEGYQRLKELFDFNKNEIIIPGSEVFIRNFDFHSEAVHDAALSGNDESMEIAENYSFRYPVVVPGRNIQFTKAIFYLHGLNERNWFKHLPGAVLLAEKTGCPVFLFPLSYHINRGLPEWNDPRKMSGRLDKRKEKFNNLADATVMNLPLSERLTERPIRFFTSGLQSAKDVLALKRTVYAGQHPLFAIGTKIDIFAYSISCLMLQVLMLCEPESLIPDTRIAFFAGGSLLNRMNGVSRYIMDNVAFSRIIRYFHGVAMPGGKGHLRLRSWFEKNRTGQAFSWMIGSGNHDLEREKAFEQFKQNLLVIALKNDRVIPLEGIKAAFGRRFGESARLRIIDFNYPYIHENPFPVLNSKNRPMVDEAFKAVFEPVIAFFNERTRPALLNRKVDQKMAAFSR